MYTNRNYQTKKALLADVAEYVARTTKPAAKESKLLTETRARIATEPARNARAVTVFSPGPFPCPDNGWTTLEGPHYPAPHRWYARAFLVDGAVVEVK